MRFLILIALCALPTVALGDEPSYPLEPPDTSSPRATLKTFNDAVRDAYRIGLKEGRSLRSAGRREAEIERALRCLDLSEIPPVQRADLGCEACRQGRPAR